MEIFNTTQINVTRSNEIINNLKKPIEIFNYYFLEKNNILNFDHLDGSIKKSVKWEITFEVLSQDLSWLALELSGYFYRKLKQTADKKEIIRLNREKRFITKIFRGNLLNQIEKNTIQIMAILLNKNNAFIIHPFNRFRGSEILFNPETMHHLLSII